MSRDAETYAGFLIISGLPAGPATHKQYVERFAGRPYKDSNNRRVCDRESHSAYD